MSEKETYHIKVKPVGAPRMTQKDRWAKRPCVLRYFEFKDAVKEAKKDGVKITVDSSEFIFLIPMAKSWSKKKKAEMCGQPHILKPDIDNLEKALLDAYFKEDPKDDCEVWRIKGKEKRWCYEGEEKIIIINHI